MSTRIEGPAQRKKKPSEVVERMVVRFAGDSGDGIQVTGNQFTNTAAFVGNDVSTFPDYPAEIRAPAGTVPGVSGFQVNFASTDIFTPGDAPDVLVAMNPAALKVNIGELKPNGLVIVNVDSFRPQDLEKANLVNADLAEADLTGANLAGANLTGANLSGAVLTKATLCGAVLRWAELAEANLTEADLMDADLFGAALYRATLTGVLNWPVEDWQIVMGLSTVRGVPAFPT